MEDYFGIDVSMKETALSIRHGGQRVWRGKCVSRPKRIAEIVRKRAPKADLSQSFSMVPNRMRIFIKACNLIVYFRTDLSNVIGRNEQFSNFATDPGNMNRYSQFMLRLSVHIRASKALLSKPTITETFFEQLVTSFQNPQMRRFWVSVSLN